MREDAANAASISQARRCPDCGLNRSWEPIEDAPLILFLREHIGDEMPW
jgi:hypothetical protein